MAEQVKIGMVGTSWWSDLMFLPILSSYERINLAAICGRTRERADEMAAKYTIPQVYTDYQQMIEQGHLDAIIVATPDDTHHPITMAALNAGLHVLCDKPIALNAPHAQEMADTARAKHLKNMVMYTWCWLPTLQRAKQLMTEGYLGRPYHAVFNYLAGFGRSPKYQWRFDANRANGALGDLSHAIHLAYWLMGDATNVSARLGYNVDRIGADGQPGHRAIDAASLNVEFTTGAYAQIEISTVAPGENTGFAIYGEKGKIETGWTFGESFTTFLHAEQEDDEAAGVDDNRDMDLLNYFQTQPVGPRQFVDAILDDKPIYPGLYEGYKVQQIIDAALQSHTSGSRVTITP